MAEYNLVKYFIRGVADTDFYLGLKRGSKIRPLYPAIVGVSKSKIVTDVELVFEGGKVILDTTVSANLKHEWLARELVRAVQDKRKSLKLKPQDRVALYLAEEKAFKNLAKTIELDTGSKIRFGEIGGSEGEFVFEDKKFRFGVKR